MDDPHPPVSPTGHRNNNDNDGNAPALLYGILAGNGAELALLLEACRQLMGMHHQGVDEKINRPYRRLTALVNRLDRQGPVAWIDLDEPPGGGRSPPAAAPTRALVHNPDAAGLRALLLQVAKATVLQALAQCVAVQRRMVTGTPYGPGVDPRLKQQASQDPRVRWTQYQPVPEPEVEALFAYVRNWDNMHLAGTVETMDAAARWTDTVLPDIHRHYQELAAKGDRVAMEQSH